MTTDPSTNQPQPDAETTSAFNPPDLDTMPTDHMTTTELVEANQEQSLDTFELLKNLSPWRIDYPRDQGSPFSSIPPPYRNKLIGLIHETDYQFLPPGLTLISILGETGTVGNPEDEKSILGDTKRGYLPFGLPIGWSLPL